MHDGVGAWTVHYGRPTRLHNNVKDYPLTAVCSSTTHESA